MDNIFYVFSKCLEVMETPITIGSYTFSFLSMFIGLSILSIAIWALFRLFD